MEKLMRSRAQGDPTYRDSEDGAVEVFRVAIRIDKRGMMQREKQIPPPQAAEEPQPEGRDDSWVPSLYFYCWARRMPATTRVGLLLPLTKKANWGFTI